MTREFTVCERETRIAIKEGSRTVAYVQMAADDEELAKMFAAAPAMLEALRTFDAEATTLVGRLPEQYARNLRAAIDKGRAARIQAGSK